MTTDVLVSPEEYLARERAAEQKHEYRSGRIEPAARATCNRALIVTNLIAALEGPLRGTAARVFSGLRVRSGDGALFAYPDVAVTAAAPRCADEHQDVLLNPAVVVEVVSKAARSHDRGGRFTSYRSIDALRDYVLVDPEQKHAAHFALQGDGRWRLSETDDPAETIALSSVDAEVALSDVYRKVDL